jgi:hypothetical protein
MCLMTHSQQYEHMLHTYVINKIRTYFLLLKKMFDIFWHYVFRYIF